MPTINSRIELTADNVTLEGNNISSIRTTSDDYVVTTSNNGIYNNYHFTTSYYTADDNESYEEDEVPLDRITVAGYTIERPRRDIRVTWTREAEEAISSWYTSTDELDYIYGNYVSGSLSKMFKRKNKKTRQKFALE